MKAGSGAALSSQTCTSRLSRRCQVLMQHTRPLSSSAYHIDRLICCAFSSVDRLFDGRRRHHLPIAINWRSQGVERSIRSHHIYHGRSSFPELSKSFWDHKTLGGPWSSSNHFLAFLILITRLTYLVFFPFFFFSIIVWRWTHPTLIRVISIEITTHTHTYN